MSKQKSYQHPTKNPNFFSHTNYFFSVQHANPKLIANVLLSSRAAQNRSQNYSSVSQSQVTVFSWRDPDAPKNCRVKGVKLIFEAPFLLLRKAWSWVPVGR